jgi:hypothetical protein
VTTSKAPPAARKRENLVKIAPFWVPKGLVRRIDDACEIARRRARVNVSRSSILRTVLDMGLTEFLKGDAAPQADVEPGE